MSFRGFFWVPRGSRPDTLGLHVIAQAPRVVRLFFLAARWSEIPLPSWFRSIAAGQRNVSPARHHRLNCCP